MAALAFGRQRSQTGLTAARGGTREARLASILIGDGGRFSRARRIRVDRVGRLPRERPEACLPPENKTFAPIQPVEEKRMSRLQPVDPAAMTPEQRKVYDSIASGPRGGVRVEVRLPV